MKITDQLRDFIKSHEMRYFVEKPDYRGMTYIHKVFKLEINGIECWVYFQSGTRPIIIDEKRAKKTVAEAKVEAKRLRDEYQRKAQEVTKRRIQHIEDATNFLSEIYGYDRYDDEEVRSAMQGLKKEIKRIYNQMPDCERDDNETYIDMMEHYIKHGTIITQGIAFTKNHVVGVIYGRDAVKVELTNGTTIIPKSRAVTKLIKTVFGENISTWARRDVRVPEGEHDEVERKTR